MTSAALASLLLRQPFQAFRFVLGDNTEIGVERPSQVKHEPGNRIVIVIVTGSEGREWIIDLDRVAMIEVSPPKHEPGGIMSTITQLMTGTYTVEEYERMIDDGKIGEDDQVELIEGRVVAKMPKKPPHRVGTTKTFEALVRVVPAAWHVSKEDAVVVGPRSKPEPDVAIVRAAFKYDASRDPTAADCCLVVEVAERSLRKDRGEKLRVYARGGIPVYWIVNVKDKQVELYTEPEPAGRYKSRVDYRPGDVLPVVIDGQTVGQIAVVDLLP